RQLVPGSLLQKARMSELGPGRVKTCSRENRTELYSLWSSFGSACQRSPFLIQRIRGKRSTRKFDLGVFTQPGSDSDIAALLRDVRSAPKSGQRQAASTCPFRAKNGLMRRNKLHLYSITSSARASNVGGTVRPSALAVLRLITSSNLVGCSTGRSEGLVPLRILST